MQLDSGDKTEISAHIQVYVLLVQRLFGKLLLTFVLSFCRPYFDSFQHLIDAFDFFFDGFNAFDDFL